MLVLDVNDKESRKPFELDPCNKVGFQSFAGSYVDEDFFVQEGYRSGRDISPNVRKNKSRNSRKNVPISCLNKRSWSVILKAY
jgi:hypothetical protein